jgi:hypothetical protein
MLEILSGPDPIGAYKLTGTLTEEDFDRVAADLEARLARHKKVGLVVDLTGFHDITLRAGIKDLRYGFGKILEWNRFPREAVITNRHWLKTLVSLAGPLVPFVTLRTFEPGEETAAFSWVAEALPASGPEKNDVA